jgi:hypothetical protein
MVAIAMITDIVGVNRDTKYDPRASNLHAGEQLCGKLLTSVAKKAAAFQAIKAHVVSQRPAAPPLG